MGEMKVRPVTRAVTARNRRNKLDVGWMLDTGFWTLDCRRAGGVKKLVRMVLKGPRLGNVCRFGPERKEVEKTAVKKIGRATTLGSDCSLP